MNEGKKNIKQYSAADIQKYLQGKLSAEEMHAIEKAAMDDPFLADAIEGIQNNFTDEIRFNNDVEELKNRLAERVKEKNKIIPFYANRLWLRIAASVILLLGATALTYNLFIKETFSKQNIAAAKHEDVVADSNVQQKESAPAAVQKDSEKLPDINIIKKPTIKTNKSKKDFDKDVVFDKRVFEKEQVNNYSAPRYDSVHYKSFDTINKTADVQTALAGKVAGLSVSKKRAYKNTFNGKVVDENKQPVAGASVHLKNKKVATVTNSDGTFQLETDNKDSLINVTVNYIGFNAANATIKKDDTLNIISLKPAGSALNEVVVTGYATANDDDNNYNNNLYFREKKQKENVKKAAPATGWEQYNNYINKNKKITTADSAIKGKEKISFLINIKNELSDFKIKHSLSPAHDAEAIRLIKNGPSWKLLKGKKTRVTLIIEF